LISLFTGGGCHWTLSKQKAPLPLGV